MTLSTQIDSAWKTAMKERDPRKDTLSLIRTEIKNRVISERKNGPETTDINDETVVSTLMKMAKQRTESITEYGKACRDDLVAKEKFELQVIEEFLPKPMTQDEIVAVVKATITEIGATTAQDLGKVMKAAMAKCLGKANGKDIQSAAKALLS